jgi:hypothetical protein
MSYIPDAFTDSTPAAAALGQSLYIAFKDHDSDHIYLASTRNPADSSSWRIVDVNSIAASPSSLSERLWSPTRIALAIAGKGACAAVWPVGGAYLGWLASPKAPI